MPPRRGVRTRCYIYPLEVGAAAQGRGNGLHHGCILGIEHVFQVRHVGVEAELRCQGEQLVLAEGDVAAQTSIVGIVERRRDVQAVHASTQQHDEETRLGSSRLGVARHVGPGEEGARHAQQAAPVDQKA